MVFMVALWGECKRSDKKYRSSWRNHVLPQLLFPAILAVPEDGSSLTHKHDPEWHRPERTVLEPVPNVPQTKARDRLFSRVGRSGHDDDEGTQHLREDNDSTSVQTRESLKEGHSRPTSVRRTFRGDQPPV